MTIFSLIITTIFFYFQSTTTAKPQKLMVTKLIHRDSIFHPQYNPNETLQDHAVRNMKLTASRVASLQSISTSIRPDEFESAFLVEFYIGQPPVRQIAVIDSGSGLLWVQCTPCKKCFKQSYPIFDPSRSSTYAPQACTSHYCAMLKSNDKCDFHTNQCHYNNGYLDGTGSQGVLATEQLTFDTVQGGTLVVQNLTFGCGFTNKMLTSGIAYPIFGIDASPLSIPYQLGDMFSYCIGSITDPTYSYNSLSFGYGLDTEGDSTPFTPINGHFYVHLEAISVGEKRLDIDADTFQITSQGGGTVLDSGSTVTLLPEEAYRTLRIEIERLTDGLLRRFVDHERLWRLCFYGKVGRELVGFPVVTFHFVRGAELALDAASFFRQESRDVFCMAMDSWQRFDHPNYSGDQFTLIGVLAQQNYNVVYDMRGYSIYFQRIDCELLMDT